MAKYLGLIVELPL